MIRITMRRMNSTQAKSAAQPARDTPAHDNGAPRCLRAEDLLQGNRRVLIEHRGQAYTLSRTRQDKLILTK